MHIVITLFAHDFQIGAQLDDPIIARRSFHPIARRDRILEQEEREQVALPWSAEVL